MKGGVFQLVLCIKFCHACRLLFAIPKLSSCCAYSMKLWVPLEGCNMWCCYQMSRVCEALGLTNTRGPRANRKKLFFTLIEHHALFGQIQAYSRELICVWMCFSAAKCSIIIAHITFGCNAWNLVSFVMRVCVCVCVCVFVFFFLYNLQKLTLMGDYFSWLWSVY